MQSLAFRVEKEGLTLVLAFEKHLEKKLEKEQLRVFTGSKWDQMLTPKWENWDSEKHLSGVTRDLIYWESCLEEYTKKARIWEIFVRFIIQCLRRKSGKFKTTGQGGDSWKWGKFPLLVEEKAILVIYCFSFVNNLLGPKCAGKAVWK